MAADVFDDDDGVIDDEAGGDGKGHQGEVVQRIAQQVHDGEGAEDAEWDGDAGDQGRADLAQEDEDNQNDKDDGDDEGAGDVFDRGADGSGAVERDVDLDGGGDGGLKGGRSLSTLSTVEMTLAPGDLKTTMRMAGVPLKRPPVWMFSTPSTTSATS